MVSGQVTKLHFRDVFNFKTPEGRGRVSMLVSVSITNALQYFITGIFYTGFLSGYNMSIVNVGILTFIPYIAGAFVIFTPELLTHFPRRRWILGSCKFLYYLLILVGITVMPELIQDSGTRITAMIILIFFANLFNVFATAGYAAWHIRFIPEEVRSYYLSFSQFFGALIAGVLVLASGWVTDRLADMADRQLNFIITMRYVAFAIAMIDVIFLLLPREVDEPLIHAPRLADIFSVPLKNKKFLLTMAIVFFFQFEEGCYGSTLPYYLLNTVHMTYTYYNIIIFAYSIFVFAFMGLWRKIIARTSWFLTFAMALAVVGPTQILYGFVQPANYIWLVLLVRLPQHFAGVGHNVAFGNFPYVNMPDTNRTCYTSFYQIIVQLGSLTGMVCGTLVHSVMGNVSFTAFGYTYVGGMPWLLFLSGVVDILIVTYILLFRKYLEPNPQQAVTL